MNTRKDLDKYTLLHHWTVVSIIAASTVMGMVLSLMITAASRHTLALNAAQCAVARDDLIEVNTQLRHERNELYGIIQTQRAVIQQHQIDDSLDNTFRNLESLKEYR